MPSIVNVDVFQIVGAAPNTLQRTGAFISQGATTLTPGTYQLLTGAGDLSSILIFPTGISSAVWSSGTVTVTTSTTIGYPIGHTIQGIIQGFTPAGYNGTYPLTITSNTTFTYPLATDPGTVTVEGTVNVEDTVELVQMNTTFFAQGGALGVYVLELGPGDVLEGTTALNTFINASPQFFYSYLVPRYWGTSTDFVNFVANFNSTTAKTYFYVTTTTGFYTNFPATDKCVRALIEAPSVPTTEFSLAAWFHAELSRKPSVSNQITPAAFTFVTGVTPYPTVGNNTLLTTLKAAGVNVIGTGAEGGISNTIILWGTGMDGRDAQYWYSVDYIQINIDLAISNAIINGSNNPQAPLYYDQNGINRLQVVAQGVMNNGITVGAVNSSTNPAVQAVPFLTYVAQNPSDYPAGIYNGLSVTYVPARGFTSITFFVTVSEFPTS